MTDARGQKSNAGRWKIPTLIDEEKIANYMTDTSEQ